MPYATRARITRLRFSSAKNCSTRSERTTAPLFEVHAKAGARPSAGRRGQCRLLRVTSSSFATLSFAKTRYEAGSRHIRFDGRHRPQEGQLLTFSPSFHSDALARLADDRAVRSWSYY